MLSKKSLKLLVKKAFLDEENCNTKGGYADVELSRCMASVNIFKVESVDERGKGMFFDDNPEKSLFPAKTEEYDTNYRFKLRQGLDCCSDRLVSLGNNWGTHLYYYEYFIYKVHAFGRHRLPEPLPKKKQSLDQVIKENV